MWFCLASTLKRLKIADKNEDYGKLLKKCIVLKTDLFYCGRQAKIAKNASKCTCYKRKHVVRCVGLRKSGVSINKIASIVSCSISILESIVLIL